MLVVKVWGEPVCEILYFNELKGLPSNHITRIIQDKQGAIWMATWNGLCLYDGYERVRAHQPHGDMTGCTS